MLDKEKYDQEAFDRGEWQIMADGNSLDLNPYAIAMVHKNNPKTTRINRFGSLCVSEKAYHLMLLGLGHVAPGKGTKKPVDGDYL